METTCQEPLPDFMGRCPNHFLPLKLTLPNDNQLPAG